MDTMQKQQHYLYRHFDINNNLLYIGISCSPILRLKQHIYGSTWADEIATVTVEKFSSRKEVAKAEIDAIQTENPKYNKVRTSSLDQCRSLSKRKHKKVKDEKFYAWDVNGNRVEDTFYPWLEAVLAKHDAEEFIANYNRDYPQPDGKYRSVTVYF